MFSDLSNYLKKKKKVLFFRTCPSATMSAALHGRDGALRMLLNRGVKPDPLSVPARWTPLMFAAAG